MKDDRELELYELLDGLIQDIIDTVMDYVGIEIDGVYENGFCWGAKIEDEDTVKEKLSELLTRFKNGEYHD